MAENEERIEAVGWRPEDAMYRADRCCGQRAADDSSSDPSSYEMLVFNLNHEL